MLEQKRISKNNCLKHFLTTNFHITLLTLKFKNFFLAEQKWSNKIKMAPVIISISVHITYVCKEDNYCTTLTCTTMLHQGCRNGVTARQLVREAPGLLLRSGLPQGGGALLLGQGALRGGLGLGLGGVGKLLRGEQCPWTAQIC